MRRVRIAVVVVMAVLGAAGCGGVDGHSLVGRWESTSSDAWIEIHGDMTFEAHDYPAGLVPGGSCHRREDIERKDWSGTVDDSTLDSGFLYVDGIQWWIDRNFTGSTHLRVDICVESLREEFKKAS